MTDSVKDALRADIEILLHERLENPGYFTGSTYVDIIDRLEDACMEVIRDKAKKLNEIK